MTRRRPVDRTSSDYQHSVAAMMSNESLREFAKKPKGFGVIARMELARRDLEVGLAEQLAEQAK